MSAARDEILARTRAAVGVTTAPEPVVRAYRRTGPLDGSALVGLLRERLIDYRARVELSTAAELRKVVEEIDPPGVVWAASLTDDGWRFKDVSARVLPE